MSGSGCFFCARPHCFPLLLVHSRVTLPTAAFCAARLLRRLTRPDDSAGVPFFAPLRQGFLTDRSNMALQDFETYFRHRADRTTAFIRDQPRHQWKPWFREQVNRILRQMILDPQLNSLSASGLVNICSDCQDYLVLKVSHFTHSARTSRGVQPALFKSVKIRHFGPAPRQARCWILFCGDRPG